MKLPNKNTSSGEEFKLFRLIYFLCIEQQFSLTSRDNLVNLWSFENWKFHFSREYFNLVTNDSTSSCGKYLKFIPPTHSRRSPWHIQEVETVENCEIACLNFIPFRQNITFGWLAVCIMLCSAVHSTLDRNCKFFLLILPFSEPFVVCILVICEFPATPRTIETKSTQTQNLCSQKQNVMPDRFGRIYFTWQFRLSRLAFSAQCLDILTLIHNLHIRELQQRARESVQMSPNEILKCRCHISPKCNNYKFSQSYFNFRTHKTKGKTVCLGEEERDEKLFYWHLNELCWGWKPRDKHNTHIS